MTIVKITVAKANILPVLPNARFVTAIIVTSGRVLRQENTAAKNILTIARRNVKRLMRIIAETGFLNPVIMAAKAIILIVHRHVRNVKHVQTPVTAVTVTACRNASATNL